MAEQSSFLAEKRYAVVTGANKGIGLEVCRQLAAQGVVVVLTSRDEKRGLQALSSLKKSGLDSDNLEFHQLDVTDPTSVASITHFLESNFGKLDILVNNAGILGATADFNALTAAGFPDKVNVDTSMVTQTYEQAQECLETNFYGKLCHIRNDRIRGVLDNVEELTEEKVDSILDEFLRDFKDGSVLEKGWNPVFSAYFASKAALNAYTRILEKKYPSMIINCLCPGFIKTDINENVGPIPLEVGGARVVRLVLAPQGSPSGLYYTNDQVTPF